MEDLQRMLYKSHSSWRILRESIIIVLEDPQRLLYKVFVFAQLYFIKEKKKKSHGVMEDPQRMLHKSHCSCRILRVCTIKVRGFSERILYVVWRIPKDAL